MTDGPRKLRVVAGPGEAGQLPIRMSKEKAAAQLKAQGAISPSIQAVGTLLHMSTLGNNQIDPSELHAVLCRQIGSVTAGSIAGLESMLVSQAQVLDSLFHTFSRHALVNIERSQAVAETYLRMALKAQGQARLNIEALSEIKAPRSVAFIRQQNNANGPQQVNNSSSGPRSRATKNRAFGTKNELLAVTHETPHSGTTSAAKRSHQAMEALGEVDGSAHRGRKVGVSSERPKARALHQKLDQCSSTAHGGGERSSKGIRTRARTHSRPTSAKG